MAELHQAQTPVPARWRFLFAAALPFVFFAALLFLSRPGPAPVRNPASGTEQEFLNARIRLQTAAIAFSPGKLSPEIAVVTDRPGIYAPYREPDIVGSGDDGTEYWARMVDCGVEFDLNHPLPSEFRPFFHPFSELPVIVDPRDRKAWEIFLDEKRSPGRFDMILLDCTFPARATSLAIAPWTSLTFTALAQARTKAGAVFAVVLPPDMPQAAICAMAAMKNVFGNAGTFRFGERIVAASSVPVSAATPPGSLKDALRRRSPEDGETLSPVFSLAEIDEMAELAGYYAGGFVPDGAISFVLHRDYSDAPPAWLLEGVYGNRNRFDRNIGALAYARAELLPRLRKFLPGGLPYGRICAWTLGAFLLVYMVLRYFVSWKPVHKQAFLAFEDMFLLTGCLSLFCMALPDCLASPGIASGRALLNGILLAALPFIGILYLIGAKWPIKLLERKAMRVLYCLLGCVFYALAFRLAQLPDPLFGWRHFLMWFFFLLPLSSFSDLIQIRMQEPVQPGPAIPLAYVLGVAASLAVFAVCLCFPPGPVVFAAVLCGFRLAFLDN